MKKLFTNLKVALTLLLLCGVCSVWGAEQTATFTMKNSGQTSPVTINGVTFTWSSSNIVVGVNNSSGFKSSSNMTITIPEGKKLTGIEKGNGSTWGGGAQIDVYAGSSSSSNKIATIVSGTNSYTIESNNTGTTYYFANTTGKNAWINSLTVKYDNATTIKHSVSYYSLGEELDAAEEINDGEFASLPTPTNVPAGLAFVGWTAEEKYTSASVAPELYTDETPITEDVTLYAVFAKKSTENKQTLTKMMSGDELSDGDNIVIVANGTNVAMYQETVSTSYVNKYTFDGKVETISADDKNWLTVTNVSGGFELGDETNGYIYSTSNNLYCGNTQQVWTLKDNNDDTFTIQSDGRNLSYRYDLTSNIYWRMGGASYGTNGQTKLDIYKYGVAPVDTYSDYTTYITFNVPITDAGWATAYIPFNATVTGAEAYYVTVKGDNLTMAEADVIPAGAGVLLKGVKGEATTATFTLSTDDADTKANMLVGSLTKQTFGPDDNTYYILANDNKNGIGFYYDGADNTTGSQATCAAGKAVLAVPTESSAKSFFSLFDEADGIKEINNAQKQDAQYNLSGVRVNGNYKGIVIINGKKVLK